MLQIRNGLDGSRTRLDLVHQGSSCTELLAKAAAAIMPNLLAGASLVARRAILGQTIDVLLAMGGML